jgi:thymidylate synthase
VLTHAPETRQVVLQIWKPDIDMPADDGKPASQDIPCNVMSLLKVRDGHLHWTQIMRSNDIMRGLPYNIIQFTLLQEVMAGWLGCALGEYFHLSDSLHAYDRDAQAFSVCRAESGTPDENALDLSYEKSTELFADIYSDLRVVADGDSDEEDLREKFARESEKNRCRPDFFRNVMAVIGSDAARRKGLAELSHEFAESCTDGPLRLAAMAWLTERESHDE